MDHDITTWPFSVFRLATLSLALAACGGDDGGGAADAGPGPDADVNRATDFVANRAGWIELAENTLGGSRLSAGLRDGTDVPPASLLAAAGECEIWTHPLAPALCETCDGYCVAEDDCRPFPQSASAGTIAVAGTTEPVTFTPGEFGYQPDPKFPPDDLFSDEAAISATAAGADADGFTLTTGGVAALEADLDLEFDVTLVIEDGVDEVIRWTPASSGRVALWLQVGHHGAPYEARLVCESADDGELTVPGSLIADFPQPASGLEQHASYLVRFDRDVEDGAVGPIELLVSSEVLIPQLDHR